MSVLAASYTRARVRNRANGPAHAWGVLALPRQTRRDVRAVYGFARQVDELVDGPASEGEAARRAVFEDLRGRLLTGLAAGWSDDPDLAAVVDAAVRWHIDHRCFERFLCAMAMDLAGRDYRSGADLEDYLDGAALAPADMVLPILRPLDVDAARRPAHDLAVALHLADLLVDLPEDLDRGRCYLPRADIERYDAASALDRRRSTPGSRCLVRSVVERARQRLEASATGLALLPPASARYVAGARAYVDARLAAVAAADFDVFGGRAEVPLRRKLAVVAAISPLGRRR